MQFKICILFALLCLIPNSSPAQTPEEKPAAENSSLAPEERAKQMKTIQREISWLEVEIDRKKKELAAAGKEEVGDLRDEISSLEMRLKRSRVSFIAIASDVEIAPPENERLPKKRDLLQEAQQLVEPLFDVVHRVSEKPRRIESLKSKIETINEQLLDMEKAIANLERGIQAKSYPGFEKQIDDSYQSLLHTRDGMHVRRDALQRRLDRELTDHRTVLQVVSEATQDFMASRGRNLLIALIVFLSVFFSLQYIRRYVFRAKPSKNRGEGFSKPLQIIYGVASGFVAIFAVLLTLHILNDWFLVTAITLLLLAAAWSSKTFVTHFVSETKLALNLGPVKQGERVFWQGIPWLIKSLGFRSVLVNESLQGGVMMLPASALSGMLSRTTVAGEPWFPTKIGDFVQLDDGNFGSVETQTPECVVLNISNTRKFYSTTAFLAKNPQNFSKGFELNVEAYLRGAGKTQQLDRLRAQLAEELSRRLQEYLKKKGCTLANFDMAVNPLGAGGIKIWMKADIPGDLAGARDQLRRDFIARAVEAWQSLPTNEKGQS